VRTELPNGTPCAIAHPSGGTASRGLVVVPDLHGLRPLFDDLVARLAEEQGWAVAVYGMIRLPLPWRGPGQREPLELLAGAPSSASPTMAIVGELDPYTPPEDVSALERAGVAVVRYPGAEHAFVHDPDRASHRPADAADAWQRALAFLRS
jgi:dienelactone hydrolase